jgi:hypothetical protein
MISVFLGFQMRISYCLASFKLSDREFDFITTRGRFVVVVVVVVVVVLSNYWFNVWSSRMTTDDVLQERARIQLHDGKSRLLETWVL